MKKNLLSIIILALLIVNIVLTAIMMFSTVGASKQTSALVSDIAAVLKLEINPEGDDSAAEPVDVPMENVEVFKIEDTMTIRLKNSEDDNPRYCMLAVSFAMDTKNKGYKTFGADIATKEDLLKDAIVSEVGKYTIEEAEGNEEMLKQDILNRVQEMFDSDFIYNVSFREIIFQ